MAARCRAPADRRRRSRCLRARPRPASMSGNNSARPTPSIDILCAEHDLPAMKNKLAIFASSLIALIGGAPLTEAFLPVESSDLDCPAAAPCAARVVGLPPWAPDEPERDNGANPPPTAQMEQAGTTSALSPFGWSDAANMLPLRRHRPRLGAAIDQPNNGAWIACAADQAARGSDRA